MHTPDRIAAIRTTTAVEMGSEEITVSHETLTYV